MFYDPREDNEHINKGFVRNTGIRKRKILDFGRIQRIIITFENSYSGTSSYSTSVIEVGYIINEISFMGFNPQRIYGINKLKEIFELNIFDPFFQIF